MSAIFKEAQQQEEVDPIVATVDEFAQLHNQISPLLDRYEALKKKLAVVANAQTDDGPVSLVGSVYIVDFSAPSETTECKVSSQEYFEDTGDWSALTVSVTKARSALDKGSFSQLFESTKGSRRFKRVR
jgi:hypothetical protein